MSNNSPLDNDFANIFFKPIAEYLNNPETSEIMVNAHDDIWVEDNLGLRKVPETFSSDSLVSAVNSLAQFVGRPLIENVFSIDARMPDGSRVCIVLPPVSGHDPIFSIRKFKAIVSDLDFLVKKGSLTSEMVDLISACVQIKKNMMVAGGTSSGKTTLLNLIAATIPDHDRIITIEDSKELQLKQEHVLALEARPADKHGKGEFSIRQCLKSSLRLRPDRIVVGEIRGGEAFDLIQAMNTGHGGCMGTVHANTPTDTLRRLESLSLTADIDMPIIALRAMIASALDMVICPARLSDGSRRIIQIAEIGPLTEKGDYQTFDIARYVSTHLDKNTNKIQGYFEFTGYIPSFFEMFEAEGIDVPLEFFRRRISGEVPEREIPKLLARGYEIPNMPKPAPYYTNIKTPIIEESLVIPEKPAPVKTTQAPVIQETPEPIKTFPAPVIAETPAPVKEEIKPVSPIIPIPAPVEQTIIPQKQESIIPETEIFENTVLKPEAKLPIDDLIPLEEKNNFITEEDKETEIKEEINFEEESANFIEEEKEFETESLSELEISPLEINSFDEPQAEKSFEEFIPKQKIIAPEPEPETTKRPSLLERLSKISNNANIPINAPIEEIPENSFMPPTNYIPEKENFEISNHGSELVEEEDFTNSHYVSEKENLVNPANASLEKEEDFTISHNNTEMPSPERNASSLEIEENSVNPNNTALKEEDEYQTNTDFSFDEEEPSSNFKEKEIPQMPSEVNESLAPEEEINEEENNSPDNKQHVVIAEILRRMRENRNNT